jgi:hypothetical protein
MAGEKFPQRKIVILHDGAAPIEPCAMVDCRSTPVDHFSVLDFADLIFVYACSWSFHGAPFIKTLIARGGRYRDAYCFDVFEGFLYDAALANADAVWSGSHATEGIAAVAQRLQRYARPGRA